MRHTPFKPPSTKPQVATKTSNQPQSAATLQSQGDYDAPWEWKARNVEEEFAKRFSIGNEQQQPIAPPRKKSSPNILLKNMNINPIAKPMRNTFKDEETPNAFETSGPKAYEIDPTIPLDNQG